MTIVDLAARNAVVSPVVCDIGCGRGTTTLRLATHLQPARLIALDQSQPLLDTVPQRVHAAGHTVETICADFHHLPLPEASVDVAVAAFCLYHSPQPQVAVGEIARCLTRGGHTVLATKSANSYTEIDELFAACGLDAHATARPSLYQTFHSGNAAEIVSTTMEVDEVVNQRHVFRFTDFAQLAAYAATSPKYDIPEALRSNAELLAAELRCRIPDGPFVVTSTVTYVTAVRR